MKKTLLALTVAVFLMTVAITGVQAAQSGNITITVSVVPTLSVELSGSSIALGAVAVGSTTESGVITVKNNGSGAAEKFTLSLAYDGPWTSGTSAGDETFALKAAFGTDSWSAVDAAVSDSVAYNQTEELKFQFKAPTSTTVTSQQAFTATVTAQLP